MNSCIFHSKLAHRLQGDECDYSQVRNRHQSQADCQSSYIHRLFYQFYQKPLSRKGCRPSLVCIHRLCYAAMSLLLISIRDASSQPLIATVKLKCKHNNSSQKSKTNTVPNLFLLWDSEKIKLATKTKVISSQ